MIILNKPENKSFVILNLTDIQLSESEWNKENSLYKILDYTITELLKRVTPDLITISGDLGWAGDDKAYENVADYLNNLNIPWSIVWGNHDNQIGADYINKIVDKYMQHPLFVYEKGDKELGNGNFVIAINQKNKPISSIFMMDTHDRLPHPNAQNDSDNLVWAKLMPNQLEWYRKQVTALHQQGCENSILITHIPIFAYRTVADAAYKSTVERKNITWELSLSGDVWNKGYENSVGVQHEGIACYVEDENMFSLIKELDHTKCIVCGHDHKNNFIIQHQGVDFAYATKTGGGCYWESAINGGTVIEIDNTGNHTIRQELVNVSHLL